MSATVTLGRRLAAEALGSGLLAAAVIGSGVMAQRLAGGNQAVALLANALATMAALYVLVAVFTPLGGAHFNPAVTLALRRAGGLSAREAALYISAQVAAMALGALLAHAMFGLPLLQVAQNSRAGRPLLLAEFVATFGLVLAIMLAARFAPQRIPALVACWIGAAYWFTASTAFANPAITVARALSDTFAGIAPADAPGFIAAQLAGALAASMVGNWLLRPAAAPR